MKRALDLPTSLLASVQIGAPFYLAYLFETERLSAFSVFLLGTMSMHLSFAVWHEAAHRNLSRWSALNTGMGMLSSWFALGPAYFHRIHEHLIHHRFQGEAGKDPVEARLTRRLRDFFPRLAQLAINGKNPVRWEYFPLSPREKRIDQLLSALLLLTFIVAIFSGHGPALLFIWILPRIAMTLIHAYMICFLPHASPDGRFEKFRIRKNPFWGLVTVEQSLHGFHHWNPSVPWYRYRSEYEKLSAEKKAEIEIA